MLPERWRQVEELYHAALARAPAERGAYLDDACAGDDAMRREIEELLVFEAEAHSFIETPAIEIAASQRRLPGADRFPLRSGASLGPYEILQPLGAGGMGEIYSGRDVRLGRIVALKVLTGAIGGPHEMRLRLEREARAISSLNHPNICTLFDIGRDHEIDYLVMEYLEGQTLAERLKSGPLQYAELLRIAVEISQALDYAHVQGVIHRDLKPGNIMLTGNGAKLVDFGLARWQEEIAEWGTGAGVAAGRQTSLTLTGLTIGTPQYMAPEQVERRKIDARTDIFALGAVIFEMATGRKAFEGTTAAEVMRAVRSAEPPDITSLRPEIPAALRQLVRGCLMKSPEERWQSAGDVVRELKRIERQSASGIRRRLKLRWGAAAVALCAASGALFMIHPSSPAVRDQVLYSFTGLNGDGAVAAASVIAGENGILYGTTEGGGTVGKGTVFELRPPVAPGSVWTRTVLHSFAGGGDGAGPLASPIRSETGRIYGVTTKGGTSGHGVVFELTPPAAPHGIWTERVLHAFSGQNGDGREPRPSLAIGRDWATGTSGALYGTTVYGGVPVEDGRGTVFELAPPGTPGGEWMETELHRFTGEDGDGAFPYGDLVISEGGAIYGTTFGGRAGTATVFMLTPPAAADRDWKETVLHRFVGRQEDGDGSSPIAGLTIGSHGTLYGTTPWGGIARNGTVFELRHPATAGGAWAYSVLHRFTSHIGDGAEPGGGVVIGKNGTLYGTTTKGGTWGNGVVFKLTPTRGAWVETVVYSFTGHDGDGAYPECLGHLILEPGGALYGTTELGGAANAGTVFKLTPFAR